MKTLIYTQNNKRIKVRALRIGYNLWLHMNGETWVLDQKPQVTSKKSSAGHSDDESGEVQAPMPGKILRLNVKTGESVQKDQVVLVMEAMKMEYSLRAACDGVVGEILCREAQQVELGSLLVRITNKSAK